jgi:hypothetical protein
MIDEARSTTAIFDVAPEANTFQPLVRQREPGDADSPDQPDYLPARMLNEFVYCPRLFYYEWVEGVFADSLDTVPSLLMVARRFTAPMNNAWIHW